MGDNGEEAYSDPRKRTCESLRLNLEAAHRGQTWLLLPQGFRDQDSGRSYPLPASRKELQRLVTIPLTPNKNDSGIIYVRRAIEELKAGLSKTQSALLDIGRRAQNLDNAAETHRTFMRDLRAQARQAVAEVQKEAQAAIASLNDLFSLGRRGIEGQMKAHLEGGEWQGEKISAKDFRECFRMVSQSVKALGVPSDQRDPAREAVLDEVAAALKATKEAVAMAPPSDSETKH